jgi:hypothetical protein
MLPEKNWKYQNTSVFWYFCRYFCILALGEIKLKVELFWLQNLQPGSLNFAPDRRHLREITSTLRINEKARTALWRPDTKKRAPLPITLSERISQRGECWVKIDAPTNRQPEAARMQDPAMCYVCAATCIPLTNCSAVYLGTEPSSSAAARQ